jgi:hypothetical protein
VGLPLVGAILLVEVGALLARDGVDLGLVGLVKFLVRKGHAGHPGCSLEVLQRRAVIQHHGAGELLQPGVGALGQRELGLLDLEPIGGDGPAHELGVAKRRAARTRRGAGGPILHDRALVGRALAAGRLSRGGRGEQAKTSRRQEKCRLLHFSLLDSVPLQRDGVAESCSAAVDGPRQAD